MKIGKEHIVKEYWMFTKSGKRVFNGGTGKTFFLKQGSRLPAVCDEKDLTSSWNNQRLELAKQQLGEECEWRFGRNCPTFNIHF